MSKIELITKNTKSSRTSPLDVQAHSMEMAVKALPDQEQRRVEEYADRFTRMINKGGTHAQLAFTIVGIELTRMSMRSEVEKGD